jgi:hypothetical protein
VTSVGAGISIGRPSSGVALALSIRFTDSLPANVYKITSRAVRSQNYLASTQRKVDIRDLFTIIHLKSLNVWL